MAPRLHEADEVLVGEHSSGGGMRILILNYEYPPLGGGAGLATRRLATELAGRGVGVDVVTSEWRGARAARKRAERTPVVDAPGLAIHRVRSWRRGMHDAGLRGAATYVLAAYPVVRRLLQRQPYDLVHIFFSLPTGVLLPLARSAGVPAVVSLRGSDVPGYDVTNTRLQGLHRLLLPLNRAVWRGAARVVAVTEDLGNLARRFEPELRFAVVRNGVDLTLFRPGEPDRERRPELVRCLCVARLTPRKGHLCLLEAFARLPRDRFVLDVVGGGEMETAVRLAVERLGLAGRVRLHGPIDQVELAALHREADLFTLLPEHEAFGNAFAEALASGLPIVGTRVGGIPELVEHGRNGLLVEVGDAAAAAAAIRRLGDDAPARREIALRNRLKAEATLSWSGIADRYLRVYAEALALRPSGVPALEALQR